MDGASKYQLQVDTIHEVIRAYSPSWDCMQDLQTSGTTRFMMRSDLLTDFGLKLAFTSLNL